MYNCTVIEKIGRVFALNVFIVACLCFILGCFCGITLPAVKIFLFGISFAFAFIIKLVIFKFKKRDNLCIFVLSALFFIGSFYGAWYDCKSFSGIEAKYGTNISVTGVVKNTNDISFTVDCKDYSYYVDDYFGKYRVEDGDKIKIEGRLEEFPARKFRGGFDTRQYQALRGVYGKIYPQKVIKTGVRENPDIFMLGAKLKKYIDKCVDENMSEYMAGFVKAMLTGTTIGMDKEISQSFNVAGVSHLIAVSGLNLSIFLTFFSLLTIKLDRHKYIHLFAITAVIITYMLMIGFKSSMIRSGTMSIVGYIVYTLSKRSDAATNLTIAGLTLCLINPYFITDAGFLMSFLATLGIVMFSQYFKHQYIAVPVVSMFFMMPISIYYGNVISLESIIINLLVVSFIPFIIVVGYISCLIPFFWNVVRFFSVIVVRTVEFFAGIDAFHIPVASPGINVFILWVMLICIMYFLLDGFRVDNAVAVILCAAVFTAYMSYTAFPNLRGETNVSYVNFINIGKSNMEHIITEQGKNILINCGYESSSYAKKAGIDKFDIVIIAETKRECYSGLSDLCKNTDVGAVILPQNMKNIKDLHPKNTKAVYYNPETYKKRIDNVVLKFSNLKGGFLAISVYGKTVAIPLNTTHIADMDSYNIVAVPDDCRDCDVYKEKSDTGIFIHPTYRYKYYDSANKYVTSREGMVSAKIYKDAGITINTD